MIEMELVEAEKIRSKLNEYLIMSGGEITSQIGQAIDEIEMKEAAVVDTVVSTLERLKKDQDYFNEKRALYQKLKMGCEEVRRQLRTRVMKAMSSMDVKEIKGRDQRFVLTDCSQSLEVFDPKSVPAPYLMEVTTWVPDKERIKMALKTGLEVPGCRLAGGSQLRTYVNRETS